MMSITAVPPRLGALGLAAALAVSPASLALGDTEGEAAMEARNAAVALQARNATIALEARNRATVREAFDAWAEGEAVFARLIAEDVTWTIHGSSPVAGTYHGLDDFVARASRPLISRLAGPLVPTVHRIWADGDTVVIRFDGAATTTSGAPYRNSFLWIFRMEDSRVVEAEAFLDLAAYDAVVFHEEPAR
ncbi:MAG: nuclear transport factor 2 family protein [Paracoccaceae bacterium]